MTQVNKFCTGCGAPLTSGARFCGSCGRPQAEAVSAPVNAAPATPPNAEGIIGVLPSLIHKKGLSYENLNIIVTRRRMIFALTTNDMVKEAAKQAGKEGGFLGGMLNAATIGQTFYQRYLTMAPDAVLAETPQNFAMELTNVRKVKIDAGKEIKTYASMEANHGNLIKQHRYENSKLELETIGGNYAFDVPGASMEMTLETLDKAGLYRV